MPTFDITIGGRNYRVEVPDPSATPLQVIVDGQSFDVEIAGAGARVTTQAPIASTEAPPAQRRQAPAPSAFSPGSSEGERISAPMPGTILSVEAKQGQRVESGQVVCVLEAMKMKNPIRAVRGGTVVQIAVQIGQNVRYGDLLLQLC